MRPPASAVLDPFFPLPAGGRPSRTRRKSPIPGGIASSVAFGCAGGENGRAQKSVSHKWSLGKVLAVLASIHAGTTCAAERWYVIRCRSSRHSGEPREEPHGRDVVLPPPVIGGFRILRNEYPALGLGRFAGAGTSWRIKRDNATIRVTLPAQRPTTLTLSSYRHSTERSQVQV